MRLDEQLAEVLDFAAPGYRRVSITPNGSHMHVAMSAMTARLIESLSDEAAQSVLTRLAERANQFARENAGFVADMREGQFIVFPAKLDVETDGDEVKIRLLEMGQRVDNGLHFTCVAVDLDEMDAAMRQMVGEEWSDEDEDMPDLLN